MCHQIIGLRKINKHNLYATWHQTIGPKNLTQLVCRMEFFFVTCHILRPYKMDDVDFSRFFFLKY